MLEMSEEKIVNTGILRVWGILGCKLPPKRSDFEKKKTLHKIRAKWIRIIHEIHENRTDEEKETLKPLIYNKDIPSSVVIPNKD